MGLLVNVYKTEGRDCTNGGVSARSIKGLCLTNVDGPFDPSDDYPAAKLVKQTFGFGSSVKVIPEEAEGKQTMMGGNYAATSDSRFSDKIEQMLGYYYNGAVPIHDRVE